LRRKNVAATSFRIERVRRELTQAELSVMSGIPQHRISLLERGVKPKVDEAEVLAAVLEVPVKELFGER
jgi:transcriptional regulator with XRE-family HTH domain